MCCFKTYFFAAPKEWITPTLGWPLSWTEIQVSASLFFNFMKGSDRSVCTVAQVKVEIPHLCLGSMVSVADARI